MPVIQDALRLKRVLQMLWDLASWTIAVPLAVLLRYDFDPIGHSLLVGCFVGLACGFGYLLLGIARRLYSGRYVAGTFDEVFGVVVNALTIGALGTVLVLATPRTEFPRTTVVIGTGLALASMLGARFAWRGLRRQAALGRPGERTLIYGAGDAGSQIVALMLGDSSGRFQPVGFIDDDPSKRHLRRAGIRVIGTSADLEQLLRERHIDTLLVAIAGIDAARLLELDRACKRLSVNVRIIPTASEIVGGAVRLGDISDVTDEDLMGRRPIQTDEHQITDFIAGKQVLITGAGGSIGSELARQLMRYSPAKLFLLDRDESALHAVQLSLDGTGTLMSDNLILADLRDASRIDQVISEMKPEIVFHAAALKHLPLLERFPAEALKTNVLGTRDLLASSARHGVAVFVNISTDKAADPSSVLGTSKLITERLTAGAGLKDGAKYVSVRFGNVLGSRGSVIQTFRYQIERGGPVTVTDERVTRYFMTVSEAVHLVLQATVLGSNGETLILDMGEPVRIIDVARHMIRRSGRDIEIRFSGLRPGEKLDEILVSTTESVERPFHPLIAHTKVDSLNVSDIAVDESGPSAREVMSRLAFKKESTL
jgi:FlaA1/EpsC-like NDP-sugar epimerase